ncbi:glycosyltransferase family 4 protein [Massilia sp. YIM B02763]|uniref:glycosyltransferase family 4 protein n=1 Tax=Massilia sp. YIM B02763 TaxID=3050130 RepID=UPI0025B6A833|nr:glycosyltransferase family 4 protein [Massilia sp. YIM B02763]MDN4056137.1 glycosyltransferase family 4 protein [Massilia sp. YIM B02763]
MNILLVNHYAGSVRHGMEFRPYYLAREWVRQGHRVTIVAASESHLRRQGPAMQGRPRMLEQIDGIDYLWLATPPYRGNGAARVRNMLAFVLRLWRCAGHLAATLRPDAVIASSTYPLDIWPAGRIARLARARLLYEVHDLWPLSPMELGGHSPRHPFIMLLQAAEDAACRRADAIVSILPRVRAHLEAHGMAPHKLHLVPNGVDPGEWQGKHEALPAPLAATLDALHAAGRLVVGYAGTHGVANALGTLVAAAERLRRGPVAFVLVGNGPEKPALARQAAALGLDNVHFFDAIAKCQVPALLARFDVAYIGWQRQPLYRFGISPNKLIDYMMAGRPVLHAVEAGNDPVAEAGCGLTVAPEDPRAVADGILALHALGPVRRAVLGRRGRAHALANHTYPVLGRRFLDALAGDTIHG